MHWKTWYLKKSDKIVMEWENCTIHVFCGFHWGDNSGPKAIYPCYYVGFPSISGLSVHFSMKAEPSKEVGFVRT